MKTTLTLLAGVALAAGSFAVTPRTPKPIGEILYEPVVINDAMSTEHVDHTEADALRVEMRRQFDQWIVRSVERKGLAQAVAPLTQQGAGPAGYVLHTVLDIPLGPRAHSNFYNQFRTGKFMDVEMSLTDAAGNVLAQAKSNLVWEDGDWVTPPDQDQADVAPVWRPVPHEAVLDGYVRKAVDRGVDLLLKALRERRTAS